MRLSCLLHFCSLFTPKTYSKSLNHDTCRSFFLNSIVVWCIRDEQALEYREILDNMEMVYYELPAHNFDED